jgi:hypothetical protein
LEGYAVVDAIFTDAVLRPEFKWPEGTIIDSQKSSCGAPGFGPPSSGEKDTAPEAFKPTCLVDMKLRVPRSHLDEVKALIARAGVKFGPSTKF